MKHKIQVRRGQLDRLIADIRALPSEPVGDHLTDDQLISYAMEALAPEEVEGLDAHLASCPDCTSEMERLLDTSEAWRGEQGEQRLVRLQERVLVALTGVQPEPSLLERLGAQLASVLLPVVRLQPAGVHAATSIEPIDGQTEANLFHWYTVADEAGNVTVRFSSYELALEGVKLRLIAENWQRDVVLVKKPDYVGAEIVIPRNELPTDTAWRVELVEEG